MCFVVLVVGEAHEVRAEVHGPAEQGVGVGGSVGTAATGGPLAMDRDAAQEGAPAVDDDVGAVDGDRPEPDLVVVTVSSPTDHSTSWRTGRPGCHRSGSTSISKAPVTVVSTPRPGRRNRTGGASASADLPVSTTTSPITRPSGAIVIQASPRNTSGTVTRSTERVRPPKFHQSERMAGTRSGSRRLSTWMTIECSPAIERVGDLDGVGPVAADMGGELLAVDEHP